MRLLKLFLTAVISSVVTAMVLFLYAQQKYESDKATTNLSEALIMLNWLSDNRTDRAVEFQELELIGSIIAFESLKNRLRLINSPEDRDRLLDQSIDYIQSAGLKIDLKKFGFQSKDEIISFIRRIK